jgi:hypothetical protein
MGYYSDVAVGMSAENFKLLWEKEKELVDEQGSILDMMSEFIDRPEDGTVVMIWHYFKWYGELVKRIEKFLDEIDERNESYYFLRIGEDLDDIEEINVIGMTDQVIEGIEPQRTIYIDNYTGDTYRYNPSIKDLGNTN